MRKYDFTDQTKKLPFGMNLQFFAEGGDPGDGAGAGGNGGGDGAGGTGGTGEHVPTFDEFLAGGHQAEFDRRVQQAINTALANQKSKYEALMDDKLSEAEKLARMTKEEKAQYLQQKREKELTEREAAITRKELTAEAKNVLAEKKLPVGLADVLNYTDADSCNASIGVVVKAFQEALETAVEERLKGGTPPKRVPEDSVITKEQYTKMGYAERLKLKTDNPELYKQFSGQ